jgi:enoyl-CoA hydratase/carnithine racemase
MLENRCGRRRQELDRETAFFSAAQLGHVAVIQFKLPQSDWILHLDDWRYFLAYLDVVSLEASVKVVVLVHQPSVIAGRRQCLKRYDHLRDQALESGFLREFHDLLDQHMLGIMESSKFFIDVHSGSVILDALLSSFACDYRIMADNATVENPAVHAGLIPRGTGVLLFRRVLGSTRTYDLLLSDKRVRADEVLRLGLVDEVAPLQRLNFHRVGSRGSVRRQIGNLVGGCQETRQSWESRVERLYGPRKERVGLGLRRGGVGRDRFVATPMTVSGKAFFGTSAGE